MIAALELLEARNPDALRLGRYASLAARVEPELLRELRLLVPGAGASAEADLWWSSLVDTRSPTAVRLGESSLATLRAELMEIEGARAAAAARAVIVRMHAAAPEVTRLEEELIFFAVSGELAAAEAQLLAILGSLLEEPTRRDELASWAIVALPRLPGALHDLPAFWSLLLAANAQGRGSARMPMTNPPAAARAGEHLPPQMLASLGLVELLAVRRGSQLLLRQGERIVAADQHADGLFVPKLDPVVVVVVSEDTGMRMMTAVRKDEWSTVAVAGARLAVHAVDGRSYELATRLPGRNDGTLPWSSVVEVRRGDAIVALGALISRFEVVTDGSVAKVGERLTVVALASSKRSEAEVFVAGTDRGSAILVLDTGLEGAGPYRGVVIPGAGKPVQALLGVSVAVPGRLEPGPKGPELVFEHAPDTSILGAPIVADKALVGHVRAGGGGFQPMTGVMELERRLGQLPAALELAEQLDRLWQSQAPREAVAELRQRMFLSELAVRLDEAKVRWLWRSGGSVRCWVALAQIAEQRLHACADLVTEAMNLRPRGPWFLDEEAERAAAALRDVAPETASTAEGETSLWVLALADVEEASGRRVADAVGRALAEAFPDASISVAVDGALLQVRSTAAAWGTVVRAWRTRELTEVAGHPIRWLTNLSALPDPDDTQKTRFGRLPERNGRTLSAVVTRSGTDWFRLDLRVGGTAERPLRGPVELHLHESFTDHVRTLVPRDGTAQLETFAWGSFTVGARCDGGATQLELDLAEVAGAPEDFIDGTAGGISLDAAGAAFGVDIPLEVGTRWIYSVDGRDAPLAVEVLDRFEREDGIAAFVHGHPGDTSADESEPYLLVALADGRHFRLVITEERRHYLRNQRGALAPLVARQPLLFRLPARPGMSINPGASGEHNWGVESAEAIELNDIRGVPAGRTAAYDFVRPGLDETARFTVVPKVGITRYLHASKTGSSTVTVRLVELVRGKARPRTEQPANASTPTSPMSSTLVGIDTAGVAGNGKIDWQQAASAGLRFAWLRATYGDMADSKFSREWPRMARADLVRGAYLFLRFPGARRPPEPEAQVAAFIQHVGELEPGDLPPALDVEFPGTREARTDLDAQVALQWITRAHEALRRHYSVAPMIYTSARVWKADLDNLPAPTLADSPLWLARYAFAAGAARTEPDQLASMTDPEVPEPWGDAGNWWFHQYQGDATDCPGFAGTVNLNRFQPLAMGARGSRVAWMQRRLGVAPDGIFGPGSQASLRTFQERHQLEPDGIVGLATFVRLAWTASPVATAESETDSLRRLERHAADYVRLREEMPSGGERTRRMDELVHGVSTESFPGLGRDEIARLFAQDGRTRPGRRVVTLAWCMGNPGDAPVPIVAQAIAEPVSPFEQWTALLAAGAVVNTMPASLSEPCVAAIFAQLSRPGNLLDQETDQTRMALVPPVLDAFAAKWGFDGKLRREVVQTWVGARAEQQQGVGRRVAIFGSLSGSEHVGVGRALGARLATHGWTLATGRGKNVGDEVLNGFCSVPHAAGRATLHMTVGPRDNEPSVPPGITVHRYQTSEEQRTQLLASVDVAIVIGGATGTKAECRMAREANIPIVPVGFTGGQAETWARSIGKSRKLGGAALEVARLVATLPSGPEAPEIVVRAANLAVTSPRTITP